MPYLAFADTPPPSKTIGTPTADKNTTTPQAMPEKAPENEPPPAATATANANATPTQDRPANAYPVVQLDVAALSDAVAARLAASLLAHVLFLKNQVPL